jgi:hypothetical protein
VTDPLTLRAMMAEEAAALRQRKQVTGAAGAVGSGSGSSSPASR